MKLWACVWAMTFLLVACHGQGGSGQATAAAAASPARPAVVAAAPTGSDIVGYESLRWNMTPPQMREAWKAPLFPQTLADPDQCSYVTPQEGNFDIGFMIESGTFRRVDVRRGATEAPGGGRIGMTAEQIQSLYAGHVQSQPNKYEAGARDWVVTPSAGSQVKLVFEADADGKITRWRMGMAPQVDYVEGCG
jgi:hypothetical protein